MCTQCCKLLLLDFPLHIISAATQLIQYTSKTKIGNFKPTSGHCSRIPISKNRATELIHFKIEQVEKYL